MKSISLEDYKAIAETLFLFRNPENTRRLMAAIKEVEAGQSTERDLLDDEV